MPDLHLAGCSSRPLVGYLKALGLLRAVSRQVDGSVRGRWDGSTFELRTTLSGDELATFLLEDFRPGPVLSPWNGRSGFYARGGSTAVEALAAIEHTEGHRFDAYRTLIAQTRQILGALGLVETPKGSQKEVLARTLRMQWPDEAVEWLDAAIVLAGGAPAFPPLLGSGGNAGSYDFSSNYLQAVMSALTRADLLGSALWGSSVPLERMALGHLQGDSSPTNSPAGASDSLSNPWDLVLAVGGTMALVGGAARRHADGAAGGVMTAPFTVFPTAAGYGAAVPGEKGAAELWLPLWRGWATNGEITNLIRESRAQVKSGRALRTARSGLDFARAAGELGVARGIGAFERYTILERSGEMNLAVHAGRMEVAPRPAATALASVDPWLGALLRFASGDNCPTGVEREIRGLERACFRMASGEDSPDALTTLEQMGVVEGMLARSSTAINSGLRPLRGIPAGPWIAAADDGSIEFAVALSVASLRTDARRAPAMRDYLHGTTAGGAEFDRGRRNLLSARSPTGLLAAIHARSHLDSRHAEDGAERGDGRLGFERGTWCDVRAARLLASGRLDTARIVRLARGLVLLHHRYEKRDARRRREVSLVPAPAYDLLALAWWRRTPEPTGVAGAHGPRAGWVARLALGATGDVLRDAAIQMRMAGMAPVADWRDLEAGAPPGELLASALLTPLSDADLAHLRETVTDTTKEEER